VAQVAHKQLVIFTNFNCAALLLGTRRDSDGSTGERNHTCKQGLVAASKQAPMPKPGTDSADSVILLIEAAAVEHGVGISTRQI
jgi:hypothetical protein